uniref:Uncharacterized protein n=1 Tax=Arundo donax TaxID=35708 RepID=A0A0A9EM90_ARUDO
MFDSLARVVSSFASSSLAVCGKFKDRMKACQYYKKASERKIITNQF